MKKILILFLTSFAFFLCSCEDQSYNDELNSEKFNLDSEKSSDLNRIDDNNSFTKAKPLSLKPDLDVIPGYIWLTSLISEDINSIFDEDYFSFTITKKINFLKLRIESNDFKVNRKEVGSLKSVLYDAKGEEILNHYSAVSNYSSLEPGNYFLRFYYATPDIEEDPLGEYNFKFEIWTDDSSEE